MINYRLLLIVSLLVSVLAGIGLLRLNVDTDVVRSLPTGDKVIADGLEIFAHHPIHDQIGIDVMINVDDPDSLVAVGAFLEKKMTDSGLFAQVGTAARSELLPDMAVYAARNLPLLFSAQELTQKVAPLLDAARIKSRIRNWHADLNSVEGIGQAEFMRLDPLGLKDLVLAGLAPLAPSLNTRLYQGALLSADGRHLLVTAQPLAAGTDTKSARKIAELIAEISRTLHEKYNSSGRQITLTPVGAYRAALDNERIIRHDVQLALVLATAGVGLLLLLLPLFSRPVIGLWSLVPAFAGTGAALFAYSLVHSSISMMVLGFGGAIISITAGHGIAYLLFLDRSYETKGRDASREVRAIGIMAVITTIGAFLILSCSGFPIFTELGQFTALGIFFSYLFIHSIFPRILPTMPPGSDRALPLRGLVNSLYNSGKPGFIAAVLLATGLLFFARPQFVVNLAGMNTVTAATLAADALFTKVWGSVGDRIVMLNKAGDIKEIQQDNDTLLAKIERDIDNDVLRAAFVPSMIFPGREREATNRQAWRNFWRDGRSERVKEALGRAGAELGFTPDAFAGFFTQLDAAHDATLQPIPAKYYDLLGIAENTKESGLLQFITLLPGKNYDGSAFPQAYGKDVRVFDASFFTRQLADIFFSTFTTMLIIVAVSMTLLLYFFYLNLQLTLLTLLPAFFASICTLGTLKLLHHHLDIPSLMLSVVILGMGIDYAIFCVRAHQRYRVVSHPSYVVVRVAVFMSGASTLIGFGVLCFAEHSVLKSIGITSLLGIGYSLLGTFLLLPPLLDRYVAGENRWSHTRSANGDSACRIRARFRMLEAYPRLFVRFKLQFDPMFRELPRMLAERTNVATVIDIGCGYGVPACWCLDYFRQAKVYGIDPDPERVRVAAIGTGDRGRIGIGSAPDLPVVAQPVDVVLLLDMLHHLDDATVLALFNNSFAALGYHGILVIRVAIMPGGHPSWTWHLEDWRIKITGRQPWYRSPEKMVQWLVEAGFSVTINEVSAANPELVWMVGRADKERSGAGQYA